MHRGWGMEWIRPLRELGIDDVALVGGKNASLGEMLRALEPLGVRVPDGFATTSDAYRAFVREAGLEGEIDSLLSGVDKRNVEELERRSERVRQVVARAPLPHALEEALAEHYAALSKRYGEDATDVAVRSSATAEDLPGASFAGAQESFLNVRGTVDLADAVKDCFASLFTARAVAYRQDMGFDWRRVALSVGVQKMVRSDLASSGVIFTLDTETGHRGVVLVTSSWGLGESVVQGRVLPDQFWVHKSTLEQGFAPVVRRQLGTKEVRLVYDASARRRTRNERVPDADRRRFSLSDEEVLALARWAIAIERHYSDRNGTDTPMDIEWAKDGRSGELWVVQARPETVHSRRRASELHVYTLRERSRVLASGAAVGEGVTTGPVHVIRDVSQMRQFRKGEVLVTDTTDPDWEPIMKIAAAIVTDRGGRTSHAAIVARELGVPAVVGAGDATSRLATATAVTVSCAEGEVGRVYEGTLRFDVEDVDVSKIRHPRTRMMLNVGNPEQALKLSLLPSDGVGLARMEFVFASWVGVHPLALTRYATLDAETRDAVDRVTAGWADKTGFLVDRLAQGIGTIAAAFHPRPVILRFSDFKTNEYAKLVGGKAFEPHEENPMLGWRGASRYYHPDYKEGFLLECAAVRRVREVFGLTNLKVMIPFCRTPDEGIKVLAAMRDGGLRPGHDDLDVYVMAEIPSNILLADRFAEVFEGFSIGSNDLTQLTLGVDRDSTTVAPLFDERNDAVRWLFAHLIERAHAAGRKVGICGEAPSTYPEIAAFLVERGIDSISLSPDALVRTMKRVVELERKLYPEAAQ
jgi:pyruvate,water dikinase